MRAKRAPRPSGGRSETALAAGRQHKRPTRAQRAQQPQSCGTRTAAVKHGFKPYVGVGTPHLRTHAEKVANGQVKRLPLFANES